MIILDTNVISEPMMQRADPRVEAWLDRQPAAVFFLTATSLAELLAGIEALPHGKRRDGIAASIDNIVTNLLGSRILPFDDVAARAYAGIIRTTRAAGRAISLADGQIAAIAKAHGFQVATRNTAPFTDAGLKVINPWSDDA